jgi:hypothetical protein
VLHLYENIGQGIPGERRIDALIDLLLQVAQDGLDIPADRAIAIWRAMESKHFAATNGVINVHKRYFSGGPR